MDDKLPGRLAACAARARRRAYAPYSGFTVGAAVLTDGGEIFSGCNIENASYPAGICAERTALFGAVSAGARGFTAMALIGGKAGEDPADHCVPCGMCLQAMAEFCGPDFVIYMVKNENDVQVRRLGEMLPTRFGGPGKDGE